MGCCRAWHCRWYSIPRPCCMPSLACWSPNLPSARQGARMIPCVACATVCCVTPPCFRLAVRRFCSLSRVNWVCSSTIPGMWGSIFWCLPPCCPSCLPTMSPTACSKAWENRCGSCGSILQTRSSAFCWSCFSFRAWGRPGMRWSSYWRKYSTSR